MQREKSFLIRPVAHGRELNLSRAGLAEGRKLVNANQANDSTDREDTKSDNDDLNHKELGVELDESEPGGSVERSPSSVKQGASIDVGFGDGKGGGTVQGAIKVDNGVHVLGQESRLDASKGDGSWQQDGKTDEYSRSESSQDAESFVLLIDLGHVGRKTAPHEEDASRNHNHKLLSDREDERWKCKSLESLRLRDDTLGPVNG